MAGATREFERLELPDALTAGAKVTKVAKAEALRVWGNPGQATVELVTLTLSSGEERQVVWKHAQVPKTEKRRKAEADKRLRSFEAEAAFFRHCAPRLPADAPVPTMWSVSHSWEIREFELVMSNLVADGFPRNPDGFSLDRMRRALEWCACLHAEFWEEPTAAGLWPAGSYWSLEKNADNLSEARMRAKKTACTVKCKQKIYFGE